MNIKPLNWAEYRHGVGWLAVTPINTTYSISISPPIVIGKGATHQVYFNGTSIPVARFSSCERAKGFCEEHHEKFVMRCFDEG